MRIVSVNVGLPRPVLWHGREVMTGIFKEPVAGRVAVRTLNLDGDRRVSISYGESSGWRPCPSPGGSTS